MDAAYNITSYYVYDGIGLVAKMSGSNVYYYHYNGSGNTIAMTDPTGNMVNKYVYDEFGNLMNVQESVPNPFLFVGQYGVMDDDNGLLYMRARYYDPQVGKFISKDPIGFLGEDINLFAYVDSVGKPHVGTNLYTYAGNNPINKIDPLGLAEASGCPKKSCWERYWEEVERNRVPGASLFGIPTSLLSASLTALLTGGPMVGEQIAQNAATGAFESQQLTRNSIYIKNYFPGFFSWGTAARIIGKASLAVTVFYVSADVTTLVYTWATFDCND